MSAVVETRSGPLASTHCCAIVFAAWVLYAALYVAQSGLVTNGLRIQFGGVTVHDAPLDPGRAKLQFAMIIACLVALFGLYAWVLAAAARSRLGGASSAILASGAAVASATLATLRWTASADVLDYVGHGHLSASGRNPYVVPVRVLADETFGLELGQLGWGGIHGCSPYGPVWGWVERGVMTLAREAYPGLVAMRLVNVAASLATAWLIHRLLAGRPPHVRTLGTLLYLWNPIVILQVGLEGHFEPVMSAFVLASLLLTAGGRPILAMGAITFGILTKFISAIFLPLHLADILRSRRGGISPWRAVAGAIVSLVLAILLFAPYWVGIETFAGFREHRTHMKALPHYLTRVLLSFVLPRELKAAVATLILGGIVGAIAVRLAVQRDRGGEPLARYALVATAWQLLAVPSFYAWYAVFSFALMALWPVRNMVRLVFVTSVCLQMTSFLDLLRENGTWPGELSFAVRSVLAALPPLILLLVWMVRVSRRGEDLFGGPRVA